MLRKSVFVTALMASTAAAAQQAPSPTEAHTPPAAAPGNEIIVTAQKREQRLLDVPISIIAKTGTELQNAGITDFNDVAARVPNLVINDTPANKQITIRGIGTTGNSFSFEQSVALFVDGVYGGRNRQYNQPFLDIERLEVLRGPQGALFGRNTSAGAIAITTARPTQELSTEAFAEYEIRTQSTNATAIVNGGITDTLSIRIATRYADDNGWLRNTTLDRDEPQSDQFLGRVSMLYQPRDNVDIFGKLEYSRVDITGSAFEYVPGGERPDYRKDSDDAFSPERDNADALNGVLQIDVGIGDHTLTAITGYSGYDFAQAFNIQARRPTRLVAENAEEFSQWSQEVRLLSPTTGNFDYVIGGYYEWSQSLVDRAQIFDFPPPFSPLSPDQIVERSFDQQTDVLSAFVQANWRFAEQFSLGAGLRWTRISKNAEVEGTTTSFIVPPGAPTPPPGALPRVTPLLLDGEFSESSFAPSASLNWTPDRNVTAYVRYARGEKGGAFSEFQAVTPETFFLLPEFSDLFEIGVKAQFPEIRGFLNVIAYTTDYRDLQRSALDINTAEFITSNAAGARTRGIEAEGGFSPADGLTVSAAIAYLDATYTSFPNGPCAVDNPAFNTPGCAEDRSGDRLENAPEWTGNIAVDYDQPVNDTLRVFANATLNFQSDVNYREFDDPREVQQAFSKTDIRAGFGDIDRGWELALLVRNLFEERTSSLIFPTFPVGLGPNDRVHVPDALRSFTIQARISF
ncbi:TonB-dependent receptor [Erythrobacter sp. NFXS35]|uniref:TonB-dependent receptor n=1 Tax=Erythrobacter sp. NFXS35 TaxID=2818436 RepID=UPI0032E02CC7